MTDLVGREQKSAANEQKPRQWWKMDMDATRARPKLNLLASRISSVGAMQSPNPGNFGPSFSETAWSIGTNKHGTYMHDGGIVGGRRQQAEADRQNQNEAGRAIHSERSRRTSGGNGHWNLDTPHQDDTIHQGFCRTSSTYLQGCCSVLRTRPGVTRSRECGVAGCEPISTPRCQLQQWDP